MAWDPAGHGEHCPLAVSLLFGGHEEQLLPSAVGTWPPVQSEHTLEPASAYWSLPHRVQDEELLRLKVPVSQARQASALTAPGVGW